VNGPDHLRVAVLIVGFRNPLDLKACLSALAQSRTEPAFDVFICENGGSEAFARLHETLLDPTGPCRPCNDQQPNPVGPASGRLANLECLALKDRDAMVWIGCANQNLGYAGGINVWLERLLPISRFTGFWIVNPDVEPDPNALRALVERSRTANKGMIGSTIVSADNHDFITCRAGHRWRKYRTSLALVGLGESRSDPINLAALEASLDCICGASLYVTRACVEDIGLMDERFFLYYEDADWSARAKKHGLGYAPNSLVVHEGGTTIGSARTRAERSRLSVYLESRNHLHFVRMHWPSYFPFALLFGALEALLFAFVRAPNNARTAIAGMLAGVKGETGEPRFGKLADNAKQHLIRDQSPAAKQPL
jgi:N-acetylglucosaminyl-diphospho-decaprenol L-rhamnosyltransferase